MNRSKLKQTVALFLALVMIISMMPGITIVAHAEAIAENKVLNAREECDWWSEFICRNHEDWCEYDDLSESQKPTQKNSAIASRSPDYITGVGEGSNLGAYDGFQYDNIDTSGGYPFYSGVGYPTKVNLDATVEFYNLKDDATGSGQTVFEWELKDTDDWNYDAANVRLADLDSNTYKDVVPVARGYNIYIVTLMEIKDGNRVSPEVVSAICEKCDMPSKGERRHAGVLLFCIEPAIQFSAIKNGERVIEYTQPINVGHVSSKNAFHFTTVEIKEHFIGDLFAVVEMDADIKITLGNVPPVIEGFDDIEAVANSDAAKKAQNATDGVEVKSGVTETLFNGYGGNYDGEVVFDNGGIDINTPGKYVQKLTATDNTDNTFMVAFRTVTITETLPEVLLAYDFSFGKNESELTDATARYYANVSGTDEQGNSISRAGIIVDEDDLKLINDSLASAKSGDVFDLKFTTPSGRTTETVKVEIKDYGNPATEGQYHITANDFTYGIDSGNLTDTVAKILSGVSATNREGNPLSGERIIVDEDDLWEINELIRKEEKGTHGLTFYILEGNDVVEVNIMVTVTLRDHGSNVEDPWDTYLTANNFTYAVKDGALKTEDIIELSDAIAYDEEGGIRPTSVIKVEYDPEEESIITLDELNELIDNEVTGKFRIMLYTTDGISAEVVITVTLTATYTLTFETNSGSNITSVQAANDSKISLAGKVPTRAGYSFDGWHSDEELTDLIEEITMTSDKTVYAKWTQTIYTLTYNTNGGSDIASKNETSGTKIILNEVPTLDGYTFVGWHSDEELTDLIEEITMTSDKTVYAKWVLTTYILTYNTNGGRHIPSETYTENQEVILSKVPTRAGHRFAGWYSDAGLTVPVRSVIMTSDKTVYAKWISIGSPGIPSRLDGEYHYAYVIGYPDGTFRPDNKVTRAEAATIFFRLLKEDVRNDNLRTDNSFSDVSRGNWYNTAVSTMSELEIITGYPNGTFAGEGNITRAEFAAICARFSDENPYGDMIFSDVSGHWAEEYITKAAVLGWINGYADGTFRPDEYITRAEAVTLVNRMLNRLPETKDDLHINMVVFTDNMNTNMWYYLAVQEASNSHQYVKNGNGFESWTDIVENPDWSRYE